MIVSTVGSTTTIYPLTRTTGVSSTTPSSSTTSTVKAKASASTTSPTVKYSSATAKATCSTTVRYSSASSTARVSSTTASTTAKVSSTTSSTTAKVSSTTASTTARVSSTTASTTTRVSSTTVSTTARVSSTTASTTAKVTSTTSNENKEVGAEALEAIATVAKRVVQGTIDVVNAIDELISAIGDGIEKYYDKLVQEIETLNNTEDSELFEGMTYKEIIDYRYNHAVSNLCKKVYEKYKDDIDVDDYEYEGSAKYNYFFNEIYLSAEDDKTNVRGFANTYFHEVGHCMDDFTDYNGCTSNDMNYDFIDVLRADYENYVKKVQEEQGLSRDEAYEWIEAWLDDDSDMKNGVSDIIRGLSDGEIEGDWGHNEDYYNDSSIENEAFAHFFEAGMSYKPEKLTYIITVFPNAYRRFEEMLKDELN